MILYLIFISLLFANFFHLKSLKLKISIYLSIIILLSVSIGILEIITFRSYIRFILFSY